MVYDFWYFVFRVQELGFTFFGLSLRVACQKFPQIGHRSALEQRW